MPTAFFWASKASIFDATGVPDAAAGEWDLADGEHVTLTLTSVSAIDSLYLWVESGTDGKADLLCDIDTNDDGIYDEIDKQLAAWTLLTSQIAASSPFRVRMKAVGVFGR